jgi:NAD(P)-dependent dehydrogenase (short-subunit alcohol dehydrogenase family)
MAESSGPLAGLRLLVVGASSGIGRAVAVQAAAQGAIVAAAARRQSLLDELAAEIGCHTATLDVVDAEACATAVPQLAEQLGGIDAILISSGVSPLCPIADMTGAEWQRTFAVNVTGPNLVLSAALPHLSRDALALIVSTDTAGDPRSGMSAYGASKCALDETIRGWRLEHPDLRVSRLSVGPTFGTEIAREMDQGVAAQLFPEWIAHGQMPALMMPLEELSAQIVSLLVTGYQNPNVVCESVLWRPRGGMMRDTAAMLGYLPDGEDEKPRASW